MKQVKLFQFTIAIIFRLIQIVVVSFSSFFAGLGIVKILDLIGIEVLVVEPIALGAIAILLLVGIPRSLSYLRAKRKIKKFFPVTNDNLRLHTNFYMEYINKEIRYLEQAKEKALDRDSREFFASELEKFIDIKSAIEYGRDLHREYLSILNDVIDERDILKKLMN